MRPSNTVAFMTAIMPFASHEGAGWPRPVQALVLARAVNQLGAFAMSFLAVALVNVYGASLITAGWVVALFGLATVPSRLVGGRMANRLGRRPTIVLGLVGCSVSLFVIAVSPGVRGAAVGAVLLGLAFEIYEPPSQALLAEMVAPERRPQAFGFLGAALAAAGVGAGILAALLGGVSLRLLFVADSVTCQTAAGHVRRPPMEGRPPACDAGSRHRGRLRLEPLGHHPSADGCRPRPWPCENGLASGSSGCRDDRRPAPPPGRCGTAVLPDGGRACHRRRGIRRCRVR